MKTRILIIVIVVIAIVAVVGYLIYVRFVARPNTTNVQTSLYTTSVEKCIKELENKGLVAGKSFESGQILVTFKDGLTAEAKQEIISSYNDIKIISDTMEAAMLAKINAAVVEVPAGGEFEWVCRLQENADIKSAEVNAKGSLN